MPQYAAQLFSNAGINLPSDETQPVFTHSSTYLRACPPNNGSFTGIIVRSLRRSLHFQWVGQSVSVALVLFAAARAAREDHERRRLQRDHGVAFEGRSHRQITFLEHCLADRTTWCLG